MNDESKNKNRTGAFVAFVIKRAQNDNGFAAALKRADNPATEYQSWEYLAAFGVNLEKSFERLPFAAIAAAIAKSKAHLNGSAGIGKAIASCYDDGNNNDQAKAKLRRLLACDSVEEACRLLRPIFSLIESRGKAHLDYVQLLDGLLKFHWDSQRVKSQWAQSFYGRNTAAQEMP